MPYKKKITTDRLISAAMEIVRKDGINAVTARTAAGEAGCSIQPVFAGFGTMDNFKEQIFLDAMGNFMKKAEEIAESASYFGKMCSMILELAADEPNVYRLLFCEPVCKGRTVAAVRESFTVHRKYLDKMITMYGLSEKSCLDIIGKGIIYTCGIAGVISCENSFMSVQNASAEVKMLTADLVSAAQRKRDNEKKRVVRKLNDENNMSD